MVKGRATRQGKREGSPPAFQRVARLHMPDEVRDGLRILQALLDPRDSVFLAMWRRAYGNAPIPGAEHKAVAAAYDWISSACFLVDAPPETRVDPRRFTSQEKEDVARSLERGETVRQIARRLGCRDTALYQLKSRLAQGKAGPNRRYTTREERALILAAISAGDRQKDVARRYGVSQQTVSMIKKRARRNHPSPPSP